MEGERILEAVRVDTTPPAVWENPFKSSRIGSPDDVAKASILVSFHRAITQGGTPQYGAVNALHDWEICLAIRESARLGNTWMTLPLGGPTELEGQIEAELSDVMDTIRLRTPQHFWIPLLAGQPHSGPSRIGFESSQR